MSRASAALALTTASLVSIVATPARADEEPRLAATDIAARSDGDAGAGRSYFAPTALTAPAGSGILTLKAPLYPAITASLAIGVMDRVEVVVGGGALAHIMDEGDDATRVIMGGMKLQIARTPRAAAALTASLHRRAGYHHSDPFDPAADEDVPPLIAAEVGAVGTICADPSCATIFTAHGQYIPDIKGGDSKRVWGGVSLVAGRGGSRFVLDATFAHEQDDGGFIGYVGYRAARRGVAFDAGALILAAGDEVWPWPTVGLSTRF